MLFRMPLMRANAMVQVKYSGGIRHTQGQERHDQGKKAATDLRKP